MTLKKAYKFISKNFPRLQSGQYVVRPKSKLIQHQSLAQRTHSTRSIKETVLYALNMMRTLTLMNRYI